MRTKIPVGVMLLTVLGNLVLTSSVQANFNGKLTVEIDGLKNQTGLVCVNVFASSQGFPSDSKRVVSNQCSKISGTPLKLTFDNLKAGNYAVAVIHDKNSDGTLNTNALGIPKEGFGFSRNPAILTGPPKFSDAAFFLAGANTSIQIRLKYF
jgi:uncharacterized protein (DUF2141 family)